MNRKIASRIKIAVRAIQNYWPALIVVAIWLWMFWPLMTGQTVVGFRDSAYFYYPYFQWIDQQWEAGEIPLWNPYCDLGHPVIADGTSSVFYPGKIVFLLRFLSYPARYGIYIAVHVLLAAAATYYFARRLGAGSIGATLAAFSFAFGGSVLFQTTNVVYLVSASWLPIALANVWMMFGRRHLNSVIAVGVVCALMILGGDPQMAYLIGLIAIGMLIGKTVQIGRRSRSDSGLGNRPKTIRFLGFGCRQLVIATAVMLALSAVQILPTYIWARQSVRAAVDSADSASSLAKTLFQKPEPGSQADAIYQFSQPPWSVLEMLWPNFYGKLFPLDQHWGSKLPGADRVWTPSLYVGLLTVLLGLSAMRLRGSNRRCAWLTKLLVFFATASLGWYGMVWLWNEIVGNFGWAGWDGIAEPTGGLYWMMVSLLPSFHLFRYPAKLFVVASLALCVLAGLALSGKSTRSTVQTCCATLGLLSLLAILFWPLTASIDRQWMQLNPTWFGPFNFEGARAGLLYSFIHAFTVSLFLCLIMYRYRRPTISRGETGLETRRAMLLVVAVADVLVANWWLVPQVDRWLFDSRTNVEMRLEDVQAGPANIESHITRDPIPPARFFETSSQNRLDEIVTWQRESLHPKHHLLIPIGMIGSFSSIEHPANAAFAIAAGRPRMESDSARFAGLRWLPRIVLVPQEQLARFEAGEITGLELLVKEQSASGEMDYRLEKISNRQLVLIVSASRPCGVLFSSLPCSGWEIQASNDLTGETYIDRQIDGGDFFLTASLPGGKTRVIFDYSPFEFWIGLWLTALAWPLLILVLLLNQSAAMLRRRREHNDGASSHNVSNTMITGLD